MARIVQVFKFFVEAKLDKYYAKRKERFVVDLINKEVFSAWLRGLLDWLWASWWCSGPS